MFKTLPAMDKSKALPSLGKFDLGNISESLSTNKKIPSISSENKAPTNEQNQNNNTSQKLAEEIEKIQDPYFLEFIFAHTNLVDFACENFSEDFKSKLIENETLWKKLNREPELQGKIIGGSVDALMKKLNSLSDEQVFGLLSLIEQNKVNLEFTRLDFLLGNKELILQRVNQIKDNEQKQRCKYISRRIIESAITKEKGNLSQEDWVNLFSISFPDIARMNLKRENGIITHQNSFINNLSKQQLITLIPNINSVLSDDPEFSMALEQRFRDLIGSNYDTNTNKFEFFFNFDASDNFLTTYRYNDTSQPKIREATTLDTRIFTDTSGKEISDADKQILIGLCHPDKQSYYLQT